MEVLGTVGRTGQVTGVDLHAAGDAVKDHPMTQVLVSAGQWAERQDGWLEEQILYLSNEKTQ
jgi:hypothetical protein